MAQRPVEFAVLTIAGCTRCHAEDAYNLYGGCFMTQTGICSFQIWLYSVTFKEPQVCARYSAMLRKKVGDGIQPRPEVLVEMSGALAGGWHHGFPVVEEARRLRAVTYAPFTKTERYTSRRAPLSACRYRFPFSNGGRRSPRAETNDPGGGGSRCFRHQVSVSFAWTKKKTNRMFLSPRPKKKLHRGELQPLPPAECEWVP